jgi:nicotinamidase-related amidase
MSKPIWNQFLTERDKQVFSAAGYGARAGFGKRPALLVIDVSYAFTGDTPGEPILESIKRWRNSCGAESWDAIAHIKKLIDKAHDKQLPVIYTTGVRRPDMWDSGGWRAKNTRSLEAPKTASNRHGYDIVDEIAPSAKDLVIYKQKPSGFFGTPMTGYLTQLQCDSVIVTGTTTSGCVRATVVDAFSYNYRVAMVEEGCFDRSQASHAMTLCDLGAKYADIVKSEEVLSYFDTLQTGMFDLPKGIPA